MLAKCGPNAPLKGKSRLQLDLQKTNSNDEFVEKFLLLKLVFYYHS
jgi:hypothetical protein